MANGSVFHASFLCFFFFTSFSSLCFGSNIIEQGKMLVDLQNITSDNKEFVLGFFSPEGKTNRYLGIWYNRISPLSVVWVANRATPIQNKAGAFGIAEDGNVVILDGKNSSVWRTESSVSSKNSALALRDNGELVLFDRSKNVTLWSSFEHPTDTFLPEMKANNSTTYTCWNNSSDPSPGRYSLTIDPRSSLQIVLLDGKERLWRSGYWNGRIFLGVPDMKANSLYSFSQLNDSSNGVYFKYRPYTSSDLIRFKIDSSGKVLGQRADEGSSQWSEIQSEPADGCAHYNKCGEFSTCRSLNLREQNCSCIHGFEPRNQSEPSLGNSLPGAGCVRRTPLKCQRNSTGEDDDGFVEVKDVKLPDSAEIEDNATNAEECERKCLEDCSCNAYAFIEGIPCMIWRTELVDLKIFVEGKGSLLFVRLARSELGINTKRRAPSSPPLKQNNDSTDKSKRTVIIVAIPVVVATALILVALCIWLLYSRRAKIQAMNTKEEIYTEGKQGATSDLVFVSFSSIAVATDNFSHENKLGQGGFGHVYKGTLPCGQEIAVKRLSRMSLSGQGVEEFTNELTVIAKLQHRNLVRLLGCCIEGEEKILVYEYMPNKSLDSFLFDPAKRGVLDWGKRFQIIEEIARGLLYLHRDSRLRIIHRDLKASNILLDADMNPKISDFGMARIFGGNENEVNTKRVVGTYGYMAPEYAMKGLFSVKSDVYSFGVLLLEIISGKRNTNFSTDDHWGIIEYAWDKWDKGKPLDLLDPSIIRYSSSVSQQVLRCIHIGLLCVQDLAVHRPNMAAVVSFLETDSVTLPVPRPPTYVDSWNRQGGVLPNSNDFTLTVIVGR